MKNFTTSYDPERLDAHIERQMAKINLETRQNELISRRKKCFGDESFFDMTFENNDDNQTEAYAKALNFATNFKNFRKKGAGLLFYGPYGTGKTYLAACIANALIDKGYTAKLTTVASAVNDLMDTENKTYYLEAMTGVDLLILDDFGAEYQTDFMLAKSFEIINRRYITRKPLIVTTNFSKDQLSNPDPNQHRLMSRLWEMCLFIAIEGSDRRKEKLKSRLKHKQNG